jgi:hypothetical protein
MLGRRVSRARIANALLISAVALGVYAAAIAMTGGFDVRLAGVRLRSHSWVRPALPALVFALIFVGIARERVASTLAACWQALETRAASRAFGFAAAAWALTAGLLFGTFAVGGADSYGYLSQALLFADGRIVDTVPLDPSYTWPHAHKTMTPLGFRAGTEPGVIAPTYPPGLPLLMTPATFVSDRAVYFLVPFFGLIAIWLTYRLGHACGDPLAAGLAAVLVSASPTFLFQVVQPMSDVPATACWLAALLLAARGIPTAAGWAGAVASLAILIRPNLVPLAIVPFLLVTRSVPRAQRQRSAALFLAAMIPAAMTLGWIQSVRYGSAFGSGYGDIDHLFSWQNIGPNLDRYPRWLTETHTWFIWLATLAPVVLWRRDARARTLGWAAIAFSAATLAVYLPYAYFQLHEWNYSRFLLPAIPLLLLLATIVALFAIRQAPLAARLPIAAVLFLGLIAFCLRTADQRHAFSIKDGEQRYPKVGDYVHRRLPADAIVFAGQHSGSIRMYGRRPIVRSDLLEPDALDSVLATLRANGRMPFMVVDDIEFTEFRARYSAAGQAGVDQTRLVGLVENVRIYAFD